MNEIPNKSGNGRGVFDFDKYFRNKYENPVPQLSDASSDQNRAQQNPRELHEPTQQVYRTSTSWGVPDAYRGKWLQKVTELAAKYSSMIPIDGGVTYRGKPFMPALPEPGKDYSFYGLNPVSSPTGTREVEVTYIKPPPYDLTFFTNSEIASARSILDTRVYRNSKTPPVDLLLAQNSGNWGRLLYSYSAPRGRDTGDGARFAHGAYMLMRLPRADTAPFLSDLEAHKKLLEATVWGNPLGRILLTDTDPTSGKSTVMPAVNAKGLLVVDLPDENEWTDYCTLEGRLEPESKAVNSLLQSVAHDLVATGLAESQKERGTHLYLLKPPVREPRSIEYTAPFTRITNDEFKQNPKLGRRIVSVTYLPLAA